VAFESWYGLFAPAGTPEPILTKIHADVNRLLDTPETAQKLQNLGFDMKLRSRAEFIKTMQDYRTTIARIIKEAKMEIQ
jgi:tripartite-type tricarboxylate transporter receptor subunit TctC